ncbi:hypothetical protein [Luteimonas terrae]|uniref:Membrane protein YqhA n=1 Tax=Luteimonas terrae TaxID=1530191 RepID=A0ABU1XXM5_9GAMM|nr:hypothetical protein [Luteimonas terrae]MDR7193514.1 putative membrane protein YqhA [Luteimonas terrae]
MIPLTYIIFGSRWLPLPLYLGPDRRAVRLMWQSIIYGGFILSAIGIACTDRLMTHGTAKREHAAH